MIRIVVALVLTGLLAGCATGPQVPPAGRQFDGTYIGHSRLTRGGGWVCGVADLPQKITVTNGRFDYPFQVDPPSPPSPLPVQIRADGTFLKKEQYFLGMPTFSGRDYIEPWVTVTGRIVNGTLDAVEDDYRCTRRSSLQKVSGGPAEAR